MALTLAQSTVIDLSHPLVRHMPNFPSAPAYNIVPHYRHGEFELPGGYTGCNEMLVMSGHSGTHLDALGHVAANGQMYGGIPAAAANSGHNGLTTNDISTAPPIVARGVLLDVATQSGIDRLEPGTPITEQQLRQASVDAGIALRAGDCVLIRTGWSQLWNTDNDTYLGTHTGLPGIDLNGARWLADHDVMLIGCDTAVVEVTRPGGMSLPVHLEMLAHRGIYLLENLMLEALAAQHNRPEFVFVCLPLRLVGASGSPTRPVAILSPEPA